MKYQLLTFLICGINIVNAQNLVKFELYEISPNKDTTLNTNLGTIINIASNSFVFSNGDDIESDIIILKVKELVDQNDMILEGVSTNTTDGILTSNGMILIEGYVNNKTLILNDGARIDVEIPANSGFKSMNIYRMTDTTEIWTRSDISVEFDTCSTYKQEIITRIKTVNKSEYKRWKKKQEETNDISSPEYSDKLFGGKEINISNSGKVYSIPIPIDTTWKCEDYEMSYYGFSIEELGWYNIDKLKKIKNPISLSVYTEEDLDIFLLLSREKVCIRATKLKSKGLYKFKNIPKNINANIIAYRQNDNSTVNMVNQRIYTGIGKERIQLNPSHTTTIGVFRRLLK